MLQTKDYPLAYESFRLIHFTQRYDSILDCGYVYDVDYDGGGLMFEQQTRGFM